jgi:hypothetical protein
MPVSENLNENETRSFNQGNFIDVSSKNNFCGYYVLARRLINDNNCSILLNAFNQFYQVNWDNGQLDQVLDNMHPAQAEIMLGLVLKAEDSKNTEKRHLGLDIHELGKL